ncbi:MAG: hypothetical protein ACI9MC_000786 [Kiritimatiellia bacterium]|jgi:hypothetical protein
MRQFMPNFVLLPLVIGLAGCGEDALTGFVWQVTLTPEVDNCHEDPAPFSDELDYRVEFDGAGTELYIDRDLFATGGIQGCRIFYESVVWGEPRDGYDVRWQLTGEANYRQSQGCDNVLPPEVDWQGTETFTIIRSDHPDIPPGCTYELTTEGIFQGAAN